MAEVSIDGGKTFQDVCTVSPEDVEKLVEYIFTLEQDFDWEIAITAAESSPTNYEYVDNFAYHYPEDLIIG